MTNTLSINSSTFLSCKLGRPAVPTWPGCHMDSKKGNLEPDQMGSCIINNDACRWKEVPSARVLMARKCVQVGSGVFHKLTGPMVCPPVHMAVFCNVFRAMKWGPAKGKWNSYSVPQGATQGVER